MDYEVDYLEDAFEHDAELDDVDAGEWGISDADVARDNEVATELTRRGVLDSEDTYRAWCAERDAFHAAQRHRWALARVRNRTAFRRGLPSYRRPGRTRGPRCGSTRTRGSRRSLTRGSPSDDDGLADEHDASRRLPVGGRR
jgi:hypothetical protein